MSAAAEQPTPQPKRKVQTAAGPKADEPEPQVPVRLGFLAFALLACGVAAVVLFELRPRRQYTPVHIPGERDALEPEDLEVPEGYEERAVEMGGVTLHLRVPEGSQDGQDEGGEGDEGGADEGDGMGPTLTPLEGSDEADLRSQ